MARPKKKTPLRAVIFDTDILVWYFRGNAGAKTLIERTEKDCRWISSVTLMEVMQGCRNREELLDSQAFVAENISRIIHPRTSLSEKAIHLVGEYALSHGLRVIDALIAASALLSRAVLATGNARHFRFIPGLEIREFIP